MGVSFAVVPGPRQRSHSQFRVLRGSWPHFTITDSTFPQPGGPGLRIYILQEEGGPVIPPGTGFPFRRLLTLAGLRWRYSNPTCPLWMHIVPLITPRHGLRRKHRFQQYLYCSVSIRCCGDVAENVFVGTCFVCEAPYPVTAVAYLLILRSLPSNGWTRCTCIREPFGPNLGWDTCYFEWGFCAFVWFL
jgi:hypothetical protein